MELEVTFEIYNFLSKIRPKRLIKQPYCMKIKEKVMELLEKRL